MNIALIGYGKMGHEIEKIAIERGHQVALKINHENLQDFTKERLAACDIAIEFSQPEAAAENIKRCMEAGVPVVSGTTGWNDKIPEIHNFCKSHRSAFIHASNFSLGVNILFEINRQLAAIMQRHTIYQPSITEIHHTRKLDAPSGTAITLAQGILEHQKRMKKWILNNNEPDQLTINAIREGDVPGTHHVQYDSDIDQISISHEAKNRKGFALGAVIAAEFLQGKKGVYSMRDVLQLNDNQ